MRKNKTESGMVIVEATIVFPVMFLIIFLMLFAGNAYLQKCRIEALVNSYTIEAAAYCADPLVDSAKNSTFPSVADLNVYPYRYFDPNGVGDIEDDTKRQLEQKIDEMSSGLFSNMKPTSRVVDVNYNNGFIYSTVSVDVDCKIEIPVRLLGMDDYIALNVSTHSDAPVSDTTELIRNIDMIEDYMEKTGVKDKLEETKTKAKNSLTNMMNTAKGWFKKN